MQWPDKYELFGVKVSSTTYGEASELIIRSAQAGARAMITHLPVHGLVLAKRSTDLREKINTFDIIAPDGQPVRWAMNHFYGRSLPDRVYGPEHMIRVCDKAERFGVPIYLYGSSPHVISSLHRRLTLRFPSLAIVGAESPPFRPLNRAEDKAAVERINASGAKILFIGLGCPLQDHFAYEHRDTINAVQVCVGAAFDFHAGNKRMAPQWVQNHGLEWAYRLFQEPRRLWRRYLGTNSFFIYLVAREIIAGKNFKARTAEERRPK